MIPVGSYSFMEEAIKHRYEPGSSCVVGILFAKPDSDFVKTHILSGMDYANECSGRYIDFFFAGYSRLHTNNNDDRTIKIEGMDDWHYSAKMFVEFKKDIEKISRWKYRGETELILLDYNNDALNFDNCISIWLDHALDNKYITSVATFFEDIYNMAHIETNVSAFSNKLAVNRSLRVILDKILEFFNEKSGGVLNASRVYAVRDFSIKK